MTHSLFNKQAAFPGPGSITPLPTNHWLHPSQPDHVQQGRAGTNGLLQVHPVLMGWGCQQCSPLPSGPHGQSTAEPPPLKWNDAWNIRAVCETAGEAQSHPEQLCNWNNMGKAGLQSAVCLAFCVSAPHRSSSLFINDFLNYQTSPF